MNDTIEQLPQITLNDIKTLLGKTWFDISEEGNGSFIIDTRKHGDIGEESYGNADLEEGRRLLSIIRKKYPLHLYSSDLDVCDEWVILNLQSKPRGPEEAHAYAVDAVCKRMNHKLQKLAKEHLDQRYAGRLILTVKTDSPYVNNRNAKQLIITVAGVYGEVVRSRYPEVYMGSNVDECRELLEPLLSAIPADDWAFVKWSEQAPEIQERESFGKVLREAELRFTNTCYISKVLETPEFSL